MCDCSAQIQINPDRIVSVKTAPIARFVKLESAESILTPVSGTQFTILPGIGGIDPDDPQAGSAFFIGLQGTKDTGATEDAVLNGIAEVIGQDLASEIGGESMDVISNERLILRGQDPASGRFIVELVLTIQVTGDFPLNPDNLPPQKFDANSDGDLECIDITEIGIFIGTGSGGTPVMFDPEAGTPEVIAAFWEMMDFQGQFIFDFDGDGIGDRADISNLPEFNGPGGSWNGSLGVVFIPDADPGTPQTATGTMRTSQVRVIYLSNLDTEFGFVCGDVNLDGVVDLLDISPFVQLLIDNGFQDEADINADGAVNLLDVSGFVDKIVGTDG